jgi:AcrR family transcriptional regulator
MAEGYWLWVRREATGDDKGMTTKAKRTEEKADRLVAVARDIIRETGDFDLPMRKLAARAQVSLRTPYEMFGSKSGIIRAILQLDQAAFRERARELKSADWLDNLLDRNHLTVLLYQDNQPFYRALFRATQGYSGGDETEPARETLATFCLLCRRAQAANLIRPEVDSELVGEALTDLFAAEYRNWASSTFDIRLVEFKIGFGFAALLSAVAENPHAERMRGRMAAYQAELRAFEAKIRDEAAGDEGQTVSA